MLINEKYLIGYIKNTHNLKGELIFSIKDFFINQFYKTEQVFIDIDNLPVPFFIDNIKPHNNLFIVKLNGIDSIEKASELVGGHISIDKQKTIISDNNKNYLLDEFINCKVFNSKGNLIGYVSGYHDFDKNNLLIVKDKHGKEILIPANNNFIKFTDSEKIIVNLPEGLIDLN